MHLPLRAAPRVEIRGTSHDTIAEGRSIRLSALVLAALCLVYSTAGLGLERRGPVNAAESTETKTERAKALPKTGETVVPLPSPVEEMRQAILAATHSGKIEDLRVPLDWNELRPEVNAGKDEDPIAHWKKMSRDGEGREVLAALANILQLRPAELPLGKDLENNIVYVWPYLAETKLDALTPAQEVDLLRLVPPEQAKLMRAKKKWSWWRLTIGADGTWHAFKKMD
jgi:hypothetical protein